MSDPLVTVRSLRIGVPSPSDTQRSWPVDGLDLDVGRESRTAIVGASGSGKSLSARALLGLAPLGGIVVATTLTVAGVDVLNAPPDDRRRLRGPVIGLLPQDAEAALNPVLRIADHFRESHRAHNGSASWKKRAMDLLEAVDLAPAPVLAAYPHQLSGGQRRRAALALTLAPDPACLIADEPTTGLDTLSQAKVLDALDAVAGGRNRALILITHDLRVAAERTDDVSIMVHGQLVESGPTAAVFGHPRHPWTKNLVAASRAEGTVMSTSPRRHPTGCRFATTCPEADHRCRREPPVWIGSAGAGVRCHRFEEGRR